MVIEALVDQGVQHIFGYPGGAVLPIYDEMFKQDKLKHILVRHEQGAVHAAEGYARSTGKVGCVLVTSGPGATNAVTGITDALCRTIETRDHDFILCNYANADMVGHTGVLPAVIRAVETVDSCLSRVLVSAEKTGSSVLITADHGNCEMMIDPATGGVHTAHTTNPVPLVAVGAQAASRALKSPSGRGDPAGIGRDQ